MLEWCDQSDFNPIKNTKKYWYKMTIAYCPVCGYERKSQERQYTPRPEKWEDRVDVYDCYDGCMDDYIQ